MNIYSMKKPKRINAVSVIFVFLAAVIGYLGYVFVPIYWPIFQLSGIMRAACYEAYRQTADEPVMASLLDNGRRTKLKLSKDNFRFTRLPYSEEELKVQSKGKPRLREILMERGARCRIEMHYEDDYPIAFTGKTIHLTFDKTVEQTLEQVDYEMCTCVSVPRDDED